MSASRETPDVDTTLQAAVSLLEALRREDFEEVRRSLALPLRLLVSSHIIAELWKQASTLTGPIESVSDVQYHKQGYFPVVKALVRYQKGAFATTVTVGPWGSVLGFHLHAPVSMGLTEASSTPVYVDEDGFCETKLRINPFWVFPGAEAALAVPRLQGRKPAVLFLQGSGIMDLDISIGAQQPAKDLAWGLASAGIVVLRVGKPLAWLAYKTKISGDVTAADEYLYTGIAALKHLARHPDVDLTRIFVVGLSMGGRFAPRLCHESPIAIAGMVSIAGLAQGLCEAFIAQSKYNQKHFPRDHESYYNEVSKLQELSDALKNNSLTKNSPSPISSLPIQLPLSYFIDDEQNDPLGVVKNLNTRILIMQGMCDWQVPAEENLAVWRNACETLIERKQVTFRRYVHLPHTMVPLDPAKEGPAGLKQYEQPGHVAPQVISDLVDFVKCAT